MRIAVLIIGIILTIGLFLQAFVVGSLSSAVNDENTSQSAAIGILMALLWLIACGFVIPVPRVSMVLFAVAGVLGFAASGDFPDLAFWGGASLFLAVLSYFGYRGKRKADQKEAERDAMLRQVLAQQAQTAAASPVGQLGAAACRHCGSILDPTARFCPNCGQAQQLLA
ncbi:MAG TPA: zinc ribbon domain-containing protein [Thermomicrobiales bacterium]